VGDALPVEKDRIRLAVKYLLDSAMGECFINDVSRWHCVVAFGGGGFLEDKGSVVFCRAVVSVIDTILAMACDRKLRLT
jgi:hypothetical protein